MVHMTLNEYQEKANGTADYGLDGQEYTVLGLVNEAGEVAGVVKKYIRGDYDNPDDEGQAYKTMREKLAKELGDVFWYLATCASEFGYTLEEIAQMNLDKLADRQERNMIKGDGDER